MQYAMHSSCKAFPKNDEERQHTQHKEAVPSPILVGKVHDFSRFLPVVFDFMGDCAALGLSIYFFNLHEKLTLH
jgi:hypothetical protein